MREGLEKGYDRGKGGDVRGGGAGFERGEVDVPMVNGNENVLVTVHRFDGKATRQIGRGPLILVTGKGETGQGFIIRVGWRGGGGVEQGRETGRGGGPARERDTLSQGVEVPVCCGKGKRGKLPDTGVR